MARGKQGRTIVEARAIPHEDQRYETCGDWTDEGQIRVSELPDWRYEFLVALHEFIEYGLCKARGITDAQVTEFDKAYEAQRPENDTSEPGDHPKAPYRKQHKFATYLEHAVAAEIGVNWRAYSEAIVNLSQAPADEEPITKECPNCGTKWSGKDSPDDCPKCTSHDDPNAQDNGGASQAATE